MKSRYLTKSRFQMAIECKTKLYYDGKEEYTNLSTQDSFLQSLADGGFQVGELAKCYIPGGYNVDEKELTEAVKLTSSLLKKENVIIFEGAFLFDNLFIRTDIIVKKSNLIELIEVKAKSFDSEKDSFLTKSGNISSGWNKYLYDLAFQKYVLKQILPSHEIEAYLMLVDKKAVCPVDGLNQMFKIVTDENNKRKVIVSNDLKEDYLNPQMLIKIKANSCCDQIIDSKINYDEDLISFASFVKKISTSLKTGKKLRSLLSNACKGCQFKATDEEIKMGYKSGFKECWKESLGWLDEDFKDPTVFDIWNFRKKEQLIKENRIKMTHVTIEDINIKSTSKPGLSSSERQWLQVDKVQSNDTSHYIDIENLSKEMNKWNFPLHFIDFETSQPAIPFNKGRRPYEEIAFQYSHHIINKDGSLDHKSEYLNTKPGVFPNYEFVENLKKDLEQDDGTIFCYAPHENTYLNAIRKQLLEDDIEHPNKEDLCRFIESITTPTRSSFDKWEPNRKMVDLLDLVKRYYYNPLTNGSNSIKDVLPAILNSSDYLQDKYSKPIYGGVDGIASLNYKDWIWIEYDQNNRVKDPYELLPPMFQGLSDKEYKLLGVSNIISDGGAALTAYGKLQYESISDYERDEINAALLKYCELDTLAMVMIYEAWREFIKKIKYGN